MRIAIARPSRRASEPGRSAGWRAASAASLESSSSGLCSRSRLLASPAPPCGASQNVEREYPIERNRMTKNTEARTQKRDRLEAQMGEAANLRLTLDPE